MEEISSYRVANTENERGEPGMNLRLVAQASERVRLPVTNEDV